MSDLSKMITDRIKSSGSVLAAGKTHRATIIAKLDAEYGAGAAAGELLDKLLGRLATRTELLQAADQAHALELSDDSAPRARRDELTTAVHDTLMKIRNLINAAYGPGTELSLGFRGNTPSEPMDVLRMAQLVLEQIPKTDLSQPLLPLIKVTSADLTSMLVDDTAKLSVALKEVDQESREAEATLVAKRQATEAFDKTFAQTAALCSNLLQIAGENELARRIRPSSRRVGQTNEVAEKLNVLNANSNEVPISNPTAAMPQ